MINCYLLSITIFPADYTAEIQKAPLEWAA